jgi:hypothetical protein
MAQQPLNAGAIYVRALGLARTTFQALPKQLDDALAHIHQELKEGKVDDALNDFERFADPVRALAFVFQSHVELVNKEMIDLLIIQKQVLEWQREIAVRQEDVAGQAQIISFLERIDKFFVELAIDDLPHS